MNEDTLIVESKFRGPPNSGNGGYVAGVVAARLGAATAFLGTTVHQVVVRPHRPAIGLASLADFGTCATCMHVLV